MKALLGELAEKAVVRPARGAALRLRAVLGADARHVLYAR